MQLPWSQGLPGGGVQAGDIQSGTCCAGAGGAAQRRRGGRGWGHPQVSLLPSPPTRPCWSGGTAVRPLSLPPGSRRELPDPVFFPSPERGEGGRRGGCSACAPGTWGWGRGGEIHPLILPGLWGPLPGPVSPRSSQPAPVYSPTGWVGGERGKKSSK